MKFLSVILVWITFAAQAQVPVREIPSDYGYIVKIGQQAPDFSAQSLDGKTIRLSDLKGKVVMLQFTASWCSVCRREMPHIEKEIWQKNKNNPDFALFGVDLDEPRETVEKYTKQIPVTYPMLLDPKGNIFYSYAEKGAGVTRNVIIDKNGEIVFMTRLFKEEEFEEMKEVIKESLFK
ncbi:TlpA family protein disulfide reductase [Gaoshiqia sediminis]|uniref:TlpA family protein disulfide reductase n=1 Tax=Gaoshiqia sediminis TaxID=2986998 RepID=A0AA41Y8M8_9BACT|nr:TlpA disulfide reductase family protein [Gaoshiqia sediminis]MCW0481225.1 TlpA family protein disulfide reductase [Gaoshiqia sediminis]